MKKVVIRVLIVALVVAGAWWAYRALRQLPEAARQIATTKVLRGDVVVRSYARGELRATRSVTLNAPNLFGTVQVTRLAPLGSFAHAKDLIVEFDDSEVNSRLEEKQLELEQIDEQIKKAEADLAIRNNQDQVDLLTAKFGVRRAELEVKRNELLSSIDAKKNELSLEEARSRLKQLESDIQSRLAQARAQIAVLGEKKNKGLLEMSREKARLSQVKLLAPMSGLVAIKQNRPNFFFPGMPIPDIREGDQLNPGIPVADILDLSDVEILARVGELDRANLREGQDVVIRLDAIPGRKLSGTIKNMSATATANIFSSDPAKKFDVVFSLDMRQLFTVLGVKPEQIAKMLSMAEQNRRKPEPKLVNASLATDITPSLTGAGQFNERDLADAKLPPPPEQNTQFQALLRPGLLADVEIILEKVSNAVHVPAQAVFEKDGKLVVFVKNGNRFEERPFTPLKRSESTILVAKGLEPGELVALADPTVRKDDKKKGKAGASGAMGALPGGAAK
jgi:HlyD family secretion protein